MIYHALFVIFEKAAKIEIVVISPSLSNSLDSDQAKRVQTVSWGHQPTPLPGKNTVLIETFLGKHLACALSMANALY